MRTLILTIALLPATGAVLSAQDAPGGAAQPPPAGETPPLAAAPHEAAIQRWIAQLGHADFARREAAFDRLKAAGPAAIPAIEQALDEAGDEVEKTLLLEELLMRLRRQARQGPRAGPPPSGLPPLITPSPGPVLPWSEEPLPDESPTAPGQEAQPVPDGARGADPLETLRERFERLFRGLPGWPGRPGEERGLPGEQGAPDEAHPPRSSPFRSHVRIFGNLGPGSSFSAATNDERVEYHQDENGRVQVRISERDEQNRWRTNRYDADSEDEFRTRYPEVYQRVKRMGGFGGENRPARPAMPELRDLLPPELRDFMGATPWRELNPFAEDPTPAPDAPAPGPTAATVYGAVLAPASAALKAQLDLADGVLIQEYAVAGGIFQRAGLPVNAVLRAVNQQPVATPDDVRRLLDAAPSGSEVTFKALVKGAETYRTAQK